MSTKKPFDSPLKLAVFVFSAACAALGPVVVEARDVPMDQAKAAKAAALNNDLIRAIGEYRRAAATQRGAAAAKLLAAADERRKMMLSSIEAHPGFVFREALPGNLTANLPENVRQLIEQEVEVTGQITGAWGDDMHRMTSTHSYYLETSTPTGTVRYRLHAADAPDRPGNRHPADPLVGKTVRVRGLQVDGQLLIGGAGSMSAESKTSGATAGGGGSISGTQNTLVLLANFKDKALDNLCTPSYVHGHMFGAANSAADVYRQTSNNAVNFAGAVYGTYTMSANSTDACNFSAWATQMDNMAAAQGINVGSYPRRVYVIPQNSCGYVGYGTYGGSPSRAFMMHCQHTDLYAHELGHNLNFRHANSTGGEYGDHSDVMGVSGTALRQLNAPNKVNAGWIASSKVVTVTGNGQFTIDATANASSSNPQVLVVAKPDTGDNYYISLRQPIGYDSTLSSSYLNRVSIHRATTSTTSPTTILATLGSGETYSDAANGYQFTVNSIGSSATVSINIGKTTCTRATPSVSIAPSSQSGAPGDALSYTVTVTNKNNSACGTGTFAFTPTVPSGWSSSHAPATLSLAAGASASSVWTVRSPTSNVADQAYKVYTQAYDTAATNSASQMEATYIVSAPTPACTRAYPGVSISPSSQSGAAGASVSYQVTVTNRNSSECGTSAFGMSGVLPSGWSGVYSSSSLSLSPGASASTTWTVTSAGTSNAGQTYAVSSTALDAAATTSSASAQASYLVSGSSTPQDTVPPSVAIVSPATGTTVSGNVTVTASASDNVGVTKVEFWINGQLLQTTSGTHSFTLNAKKYAGSTMTISARAFDAAGNVASASSVVNVSSGGRGKGR